ncbi:MAG: disulfide bond formation protein DsbB [Ilumatobacter sp.]|jgi:disulfide bond formation protein DsbB
MSSETIAALFAACLLGGFVGGIALYVAQTTRSKLVAAAPQIAAVVAIAATAGSLYFSAVADFVPCKLCWYQRIAMYPMAIILPLAVLLRDRLIMRYAAALAGIGLAVSLYHIQVQWFPERSNSCSFDDPCSAKWVEAFGVFTIPQMAAMAFALIVLLSVAVIVDQRSDDDSSNSRQAAGNDQSVASGG